MANTTDTRTSQLNTSKYWHIVFPVLVLLLLFFILFVVYTMPDWALDCPDKGGLQLRALARTTANLAASR